MNKWINQSIN